MVAREHTGKPLYFISHTWSQPLAQTTAALEDRFKTGTSTGDGDGDPLIWLDIFAVRRVCVCVRVTMCVCL